ncbi:GIN domain-containing protein [Tenacibaculum geojense]|uniref:GIN domain-containing protein n=1 Tax=Tenacibaculum geojense TaxID=915352 RepID=A0ABW3JWQ1_9FLAO
MNNKIIVVLVLLCFSTSIFCQKKIKIKGDKNIITNTQPITSEFNAIEINDNINLILIQDVINEYKLTADENLHEVLKFNVKDSILKIYSTHKITSNKKLDVTLKFVNLKHIIIKNKANIKAETPIKGNIFYVTAHSSSNFNLNLKTNESIITLQRNSSGKLKCDAKNVTLIMNDNTSLKADINTIKASVTLTKNASLKLKGESNYCNYNIKDNSELNAQGLKAKNIDLYSSNKAKSSVNSSKNLELYAKGKSNIYIYGDPVIEIKGLTDKSKLIKK